MGRKKKRDRAKGWKEDRDVFLIGRKSAAALLKKRGMQQRRESTQGLCGQKPDSESVDGCRGHALHVFLFFSSSPPVSLTIAFTVDSGAFFSLLSFLWSLFFHNQAADRWTGAMMDDALSESDNIFSQSPKQDRAVSDVGPRWPLSVFVRSNCCVQSPLSRPPYQLRRVCAN